VGNGLLLRLQAGNVGPAMSNNLDRILTEMGTTAAEVAAVLKANGIQGVRSAWTA